MNSPGRPINSRDRQILNDLGRPGLGPAQHVPERLATLGYSLPRVIDSAADEWNDLSSGRLSIIRPLSSFDVRSARCLVKIDTGTDQEIVRFDFGIYVVNPTDWRLTREDDFSVRAVTLNAAPVIPLREFWLTRSNLADVSQFTEICYERPVRLLGGQFYAFLVAPRVAGEEIWCPSAGDTQFSLDSGNIEEHIQITGMTASAPAIELRSELGTRVFTGGAPFVRF